MKLNSKRTVLVGLAFLSICAFWQLYDNVVPLILKETFGISDSVAGVVMALDNAGAVLLPFSACCPTGAVPPSAGACPTFWGHRRRGDPHESAALADKTRNFPLFIVGLGLLLIAMGTYRSPAVA